MNVEIISKYIALLSTFIAFLIWLYKGYSKYIDGKIAISKEQSHGHTAMEEIKDRMDNVENLLHQMKEGSLKNEEKYLSLLEKLANRYSK